LSSGATHAPHEALRAPDEKRSGALGFVHSTEGALVALLFAAMVCLPLAEIGLRRVFDRGIPGTVPMVQHLTLLVGMGGAAIAARQGRLLALSTLSARFGPSLRAASSVYAAGFSGAVALALAYAGWHFAQGEREGGLEVALGVPTWIVQLCLPLGFGVLALRQWFACSSDWVQRAAALVLSALLVLLARNPPVPLEQLHVWGLALCLLAAVAGAPIYAVLAGAASVLYLSEAQDLGSLPLDHYRLVTHFTLPTLPLFTLAGTILALGGASRRLVRVFNACFGALRGGQAIATALACAFFTTFTGASGVTILALGTLLMPVLLSAGYRERDALGLLTGAGSLGLLFPPCVPLILYAIIASSNGSLVSMEQMFLGGIGPGMLLLGLTMAWGVALSPRGTAAAPRPRFDAGEALSATWDAKWELAVPIVAIGMLFGGWATPVEAAAATAGYALFVEAVIYRDLRSPRALAGAFVECAALIGGVLLILGVALGLTTYLVFAMVPEQAVEWATASIESRWVFLLALNVFLLGVGCLMDVYSAIVVIVPILVRLGEAYQIDPVHLGILFLANMELGYLTPPVGMNLFLASYRFNKPMGEVIRASLPMLFVLAFGVLVITYWPALTTWLPSLRAP